MKCLLGLLIGVVTIFTCTQRTLNTDSLHGLRKIVFLKDNTVFTYEEK